MNTFPYHAMTRPYAGDSPRWRTTDGGVASLTLGSGILRTRAELGQAIWAVDLQFQGLTQADASALWSFYVANRAATFYWSDPKTGPFASSAFATYECRFDPATLPDIAPSSQLPDRYDAAMTLLPAVPTVAEEMLVAHWKMNDAAATTDVVDATGNGHTGTASANTDTLTVAGKIGTALEFVTASSRYVSVPDHDDLDLTAGGTIAMWVKWDGTFVITDARNPRLFDRVEDPQVCLIAGGAIQMRMAGAASGRDTRTSTGVLVAGQWTHVACVFGQAKAIYVNGVDRTETRGDSRLPTLTGGSFIGSRNTVGGFFGGVLDDVRIYKRPLSVQEIQAIYNSGSGTEEVIVP